MRHPMPNLGPPPLPLEPSWTLEVVRGAGVGRVYPLDGAELILGNATGGADGKAFLNLADQEGASPRKMAASQAALSRSGSIPWTVRDLDSPGGTFVNNRRVLAGVAHPLAEGDVIQVGSVQLRLGRAEATVDRVFATPPSFTYRSSTSGTTCRTWDDFLTFSSQRWDELRDDLVSGRLGDFLGSAGHPELIPLESKTKLAPEEADERLDAWLARLPTRTPSQPELDVHPLRIAVSVPAGGVTIRRKVRVANVGHRLLRVKVGVESSDLRLNLGPEVEGRELVIRDFLDVPFDLAVPDPFSGPSTASLVVAGGGVEKRVLIQVDRKSNPSQPGPPADDPGLGPSPIAGFAAMPLGKRVVVGALTGVATRLVVGVIGGAIGEDAMAASGADLPRLGAEVCALSVAGACLGGWAAIRRGGRLDALFGVVSGAGLGALVASILVAACRAVEPLLGPLASSPIAVCGLWAVIGGTSAGLTSAGIPRGVEATEGPAR